MKYLILMALAILTLAGCSSTPQYPVEDTLTIVTDKDADQVQAMLIDFTETDETMLKNKMEIHSVTPHALNIRTHCYNVLDSFKCSLLMMSVGNTGWDGPYIYINFNTLDVGATTRIKARNNVCATNMMGKQNCTPLTHTDWTYSMNRMLERFEQTYLIQGSSATTSP